MLKFLSRLLDRLLERPIKTRERSHGDKHYR